MIREKVHFNAGLICTMFCAVMLFGADVAAENKGAQQAPRNGFAAMGLKMPKDILGESFPKNGFFASRFDGSVENVDAKQVIAEQTPAVVEKAPEVATQNVEEQRNKVLQRVSADAPNEFKDMVYNFRTGDATAAQNSARSYVDYLTDLMFELRVYTQMIGQAFIDRKMIEEEDWVGVEQLLNWTLASSQAEGGNPLKMTHQAALKRIKPDPNHQVEVYYFFNLSSSYSRAMAPDVERLWQAVRNDKNVKMVAVTVEPVPQSWLQSYREFTGLTMPVYNSAALAQKFKIALVPAVVVVSPTLNAAYLKTGQQDFKNLYEFVRTTQGLSIEMTPALQRLATIPVGQLQNASTVKVAGVKQAGLKQVRTKASLEKF